MEAYYRLFDPAMAIVHSFILTWLYCCNTVLRGPPKFKDERSWYKSSFSPISTVPPENCCQHAEFQECFKLHVWHAVLAPSEDKILLKIFLLLQAFLADVAPEYIMGLSVPVT